MNAVARAGRLPAGYATQTGAILQLMPRARRRPTNPATLTANVPTGVVQIVGVKRRFILREPIDLDVRREAGRCVIEYAPLRLSVGEPSEEQAFAAFADMFEVLWEQYAEAPDRTLTKDARDLKAALRSAVCEVEAVAA